MPKILIIEDDRDMASGLEDNLEFEGYNVLVRQTGPDGVAAVLAERPELVLLDVMLPGFDGFEACRRIREAGLRVPIIMLTARGQEMDIVRGLELGADDYITKPFSLRELLARAKAAIRRSQTGAAREERLEIGSALVDLRRGLVMRDGKEHMLGHYEIEILRLLIASSGQNVSRAEILRKVWEDTAISTERAVDNHIVSLRKKIEAQPRKPRHILAVHGIGYKYTP
jgi:DNA-binding response OmpR family regulator